ncbi:MAG: LytTR family DNA-binding domain-containing protein [Pedobacter sp.]
MTALNCLIVDDEPIARDIINSYCAHLTNLKVIASCGNALEAKAILQNQHIDILFLDINMPVIDGVSFAKTLKNKPQIIFSTAYKEYATDAFDLEACDYLLKPFSFDRFMIAVDKAIARLKPGMAIDNSGLTSGAPDQKEDYLFIKTDGKIFKVLFDELKYAEAQGNYTRIVTQTTTLMPKMPFSSFEELLPSSRFIRIHRSFMINKSKISHIEGNRVFIGEAELPIGNNYRELLLKELGFNKA